MRSCTIALLSLALLVTPLFAVEKQYHQGTIIGIEPKVNTKILYYLVNTPVTQDDPYFEISVRMMNTIYVCQYAPKHAADGLPDDWKIDSEVEGRLEKRHLFVKRPNGAEVDLTIVKRLAAASSEVQPGPAKR